MKKMFRSFHATSLWNKILLISGLLLLLTAVFGQLLPIADPNEQSLDNGLLPPFFLEGGSSSHLFGTDLLGRDLFSRLVHGTRMTVLIAVSAVFLGAVFGSLLGVIAGFKGGKIDSIISRITEAQLALPFILLAISMIVSRGQSLSTLVIVLAVVGWAQYVRIIRAETLSIKERGFVTGLRVGGISDTRIIFFHIVPNVFGTILSLATLEIGTMILAESALSFLGLGIPAPSVSWGADLASGKDFIDMAWWLVTFPGIAIVVTVLYVNAAGDALRTHFDLRKRMF
jgi:peptide/nickel transport system permease protein